MPEAIHLNADERRVLGVLIEKGLTTPQYYPLTVNAIVTGCNQKSNRDPIVQMVDDEIEEVLQGLREKHLATVTFPASSRSEKWRQELTSTLEISGAQMAVIAELLLRGAQTLGELRARANRMKPITDMRALEEVLDSLIEREPPLVVRLTPPGQKRGARVTHCLYPAAELETIVEREKAGAPAASAAPRPRAAAAPSVALDAVVAEIDALKRRVEALEGALEDVLEERTGTP